MFVKLPTKKLQKGSFEFVKVITRYIVIFFTPDINGIFGDVVIASALHSVLIQGASFLIF